MDGLLNNRSEILIIDPVLAGPGDRLVLPSKGLPFPRSLSALIAVAFVAVLAVVMTQNVAGDDYEPAAPWEFQAQWGWYGEDRVTYYDLGRAQNTTAPVYRLVYGSGNPVEGQYLIFADLRPGLLVGAPISGNYSDFHRIWDVQVATGYVPNDIRSFADILAANLTMTQRDLVWNTPMAPEGSILVGTDEGLYPLVEGWWNGLRVYYWRFESSQDTPGLFDPGTGLVRDASALAVFDPPGQLEILDTYPGEATYSPLTRLYTFNPISTEFVADSVRSTDEVDALEVPTFPEGNLYNRPVVGGREEYPRYDHDVPPTYNLLEAWHSETSKVLYYDMGPMVEGVAPLYRFVTKEGIPIITQHWLVDFVAPGVLIGQVDTQGYSTLWQFYDIVVDDETTFDPDVIKSMEDVRAMGFEMNASSEFIIAPMVTRGPAFLPPPSNPPGDMRMAWYRGADVYLVVLDNGPVLEQSDGAPSVATVNVTLILGPDGEPYPSQRPIMEDLPDDGNYSSVWSVVWASDGDGYRQGRFRSIQQLEERGWKVETSGELILGGFVAGPVNVPAWKPDRFTFVVGPVLNEDGKALKGANVRVSMGSEVVEGPTDGSGRVEFEVDNSWNDQTVTTFVSRAGYLSNEFPAEIIDYEHYQPAGGYVPPMVLEDNGASIDWLTAVMLAVVLIVVVVIVLAFGRDRSRDRGTITEEEADEIFSDDTEDGEDDEAGPDREGLEGDRPGQEDPP